jgi:hypothetical protein
MDRSTNSETARLFLFDTCSQHAMPTECASSLPKLNRSVSPLGPETQPGCFGPRSRRSYSSKTGRHSEASNKSRSIHSRNHHTRPPVFRVSVALSGTWIKIANLEAAMKLTSLVLTFSLTVIVGLVALGGSRSEAYYRAAAAGCGPRGCAAATASGGRYRGYYGGAYAVRRY